MLVKSLFTADDLAALPFGSAVDIEITDKYDFRYSVV